MSVRKSPKIQKLVVNAIRKLQDVQGSSPREISNYISQEYDVPSTKIQRQVRLALARAVSYGILQRAKGGYYACNRDCLGCPPQLEEGQLTEKCAPRRGRGHMKRARSCKSRKRKRRATSCGNRRGRRAAGRRSRKRSRRVRGKSGGRRCGTSGGGKKSRRRRERCSRGTKSRRRARRSRRSGRRGKKCSTGDNGDGRTGSGDDLDVFGSRGGRRARSISAARNRNRSGSSLSGSFDDEGLDEKLPEVQPVESPESLID